FLSEPPAAMASSPTDPNLKRSRPPATLWIGLGIMLLCEALLFTDVHLSGRGPVHANVTLPAPQGMLGEAARWMAGNMTAIVWTGLLFFLDGVLACLRRGSPARNRPHHFWMLWIASIFIWCVFDM